VIAVKAQDIDTLLEEVGRLLSPEQTGALDRCRDSDRLNRAPARAAAVPVVRAMPNVASTVHEGIAGMCAGSHAAREHLDQARTVLRAVGDVVEVARGVDGRRSPPSRDRGPAYYALLAEADDRSGDPAQPLARGLDEARCAGRCSERRRSSATRGCTRSNCAEMVTSPGGTTIYAIRELELAGVRAAF